MPRSLTHCRLGLLRQLVHARRPLLITDLALGTARLLGAKLNDQSLALLRDLHSMGGKGNQHAIGGGPWAFVTCSAQ